MHRGACVALLYLDFLQWRSAVVFRGSALRLHSVASCKAVIGNHTSCQEGCEREVRMEDRLDFVRQRTFLASRPNFYLHCSNIAHFTVCVKSDYQMLTNQIF